MQDRYSFVSSSIYTKCLALPPNAQRPIITPHKSATKTLSPLHPDQILRVLAITDSFNIHRETVFIPLRMEKAGSAMILPDGRLQITCPDSGNFEEWLNELRGQLEKLDLSKLGKRQT